MPSLKERHRNNVRAGIFVSATMLLALGVLFALTDAWRTLLAPTRAYTVTFTVASGVNALKPGSDVRVGGLELGRVETVEPRLEPDAPFELIDVRFSIERRVRLYADAQIFVSAPLLGSDAWLNIPSVGTAGAGDPPDGRLDGASSPGALAGLLGPDNAAAASDIVAKIPPILDDIKVTSGHLRELSTDVAENRWPTWAERIDDVTGWASDATPKLDELLATGRDTLDDARSGVNEIRDVVRDNRPHVDRIAGNVDDITTRVRDETVDKVHDMLDTGREALAEAEGTIRDVRGEFATWAPQIDETLATATLATQQLKLASIEVRRNPWKLFYRPRPEELEHELLYDAARSFALAAADLKAATRTVESVLDRHGERVRQDEALFQRVLGTLERKLTTYQDAQQQLFDILLEDY